MEWSSTNSFANAKALGSSNVVAFNALGTPCLALFFGGSQIMENNYLTILSIFGVIWCKTTCKDDRNK